MKLKAFAIDRENGHDLGHSTQVVDFQESDNLEVALGYVAKLVIGDMRRLGFDARQYDINLRFE